MNRNVSQVIELFENKDVVLLGEAHGIHENLQFVIDLVPHLHEAGVRNIALEFSCEEMQSESDSLVQSAVYDPQISRDMLFAYNTGWPYVEYQDVHRAVWKFNCDYNASMRVLHPSYVYDWGAWDGARTEETMRKIMHRGHYNIFRAGRILEAINKGEKVLGLFGAFHAIRKQPPFEIPTWLGSNQTLGQLLDEKLPGRIGSVCLNNAMAGEWDLHLQIADELSPCAIDYKFLDGKDFQDLLKNWPDPDWTATPNDIDDYWKIIEGRKLV